MSDLNNPFSESSRPDSYENTLFGIGNLPVVEENRSALGIILGFFLVKAEACETWVCFWYCKKASDSNVKWFVPEARVQF